MCKGDGCPVVGEERGHSMLTTYIFFPLISGCDQNMYYLFILNKINVSFLRTSRSYSVSKLKMCDIDYIYNLVPSKLNW